MSALGNLVKAANWDRYTSTLFAPADKREALFSLYAFDAEVSRICDLVHDPLPGEIRLQWWRDVANGERSGEAAAHPLASALVRTMQAHDLPQSAFDAYCEARIFDVYHDVMPDRTALEAYLGATQSAIIQLAAMVLDRSAASLASEAAGHAGVAAGIANIIRLLPVIRSKGRGFVPQDILAAAGLSQETLLASGDAAATKRAVEAMIALADSHYSKFQRLKTALPGAVLPAFLPVEVVPRMLRSLRRNQDPGGRLVDVPALPRLWDITREALFSQSRHASRLR